MNLGFEVTSRRTPKTSDLSPSAVTATCRFCGKTIGKTRAQSGADLWVAEGNGGVLCTKPDAQSNGGHRPKTAAAICGHPQCDLTYIKEHGNAESHAIHRDKQTPQGWIPNPHTHEEWKGNPELERQFKDDKTSSLTVTAKRAGYEVDYNGDEYSEGFNDGLHHDEKVKDTPNYLKGYAAGEGVKVNSAKTAGPDGRGPGSGLYDPIGTAQGFDPNGKWCEGIGETPNSRGGCARCYLENAELYFENAELSDGGYVKRHNPVLVDGSILASRKTAVENWDAIMRSPEIQASWSQLRPLASQVISRQRQEMGDYDSGISSSDVNHTIFEAAQRHWDGDKVDVVALTADLLDEVGNLTSWGFKTAAAYDYSIAPGWKVDGPGHAGPGGVWVGNQPSPYDPGKDWIVHWRDQDAQGNQGTTINTNSFATEDEAVRFAMNKSFGDRLKLSAAATTPGYYVVSRNGSVMSGPYATVPDAAPHMIEQRGATVQFVGPGDDADWAATKAKAFPVGTNTVNGSRKTARLDDQLFDVNGNAPAVGATFVDNGVTYTVTAVNDLTVQLTGDNGYSTSVQRPSKGPDGNPLSGFPWSNPEDVDLWSTGSRHTAGDVNYGGGPGSDDPGIEFDYVDAGHKAIYNGLGTDGTCEVCGQPVLFDGFRPGKDDDGHYDPRGEKFWKHVRLSPVQPVQGSMQERYATVRRVASLRHFAEESCALCGGGFDHHSTDEHPSYEEIQSRGYDVFGDPLAKNLGEVGDRIDRHSTLDDDWEKQPRGLTDQVDTGEAPESEIQAPNPLAGQDVVAGRAPRTLYEAQLWTQADMFPGPGAQIDYNEAGEPLGWDYPSYDDGGSDPYDDYDARPFGDGRYEDEITAAHECGEHDGPDEADEDCQYCQEEGLV